MRNLWIICLCIVQAFGCAPAHQVAEYELVSASKEDATKLEFINKGSYSSAKLFKMKHIYGQNYVGVVARLPAQNSAINNKGFMLKWQGKTYHPIATRFADRQKVELEDPNSDAKNLALVLFFLLFIVIIIAVVCDGGCKGPSFNGFYFGGHHGGTGRSGAAEPSPPALKDGLSPGESGYVFLIFENIPGINSNAMLIRQ